ncbi:MAG TPA: hypothetical protein VIV60_36345, partial [Polyangiaceae bacterium]
MPSISATSIQGSSISGSAASSSYPYITNYHAFQPAFPDFKPARELWALPELRDRHLATAYHQGHRASSWTAVAMPRERTSKRE